MELRKARCMGFCQGVKRAISLVRSVTCRYGGRTVYLYGELAHNKDVLSELHELGTVTVHSPEEIPVDAPVVIRAHGISDEVRAGIEERTKNIYDATCPLVLQNQNLMRNSCRDVILIGIPGHSETVAVEGAARRPYTLISGTEDVSLLDRDRPYKVIVQTTFETGKLRDIFEEMERRNIIFERTKTICQASQKRREALHELAKECDVIFVAGDRMSANSNALVSEARNLGVPSFLIESGDEIHQHMEKEWRVIGLCAGSSTPDEAIEKAARRIEEL